MDQRINIMTPAFRADPYSRYAELRLRAPVCQVDPGGLFAVSRYSDVVTVLKNPDRFSSRGFKMAWQPPWVGHNPLANSILAMDGPDHTRLRGLVARAFNAPAIARLEAQARALSERLVGQLANAGGDVDFVSAVAAPIPAFVICELIGLDHALEPRFQAWTDDLLSVTPEPQGPEHEARVLGTIKELTGHLAEVVEARRRAPSDDLVSELVRASVGGDAMTERAIVDLLVSVLGGGLETTAHLISNSMLFLADHPDVFERLRASRELLPKFIEEMNRYDGATQAVPRVTLEDVELGGVRIPAMSLVLALVGSANRDEQQFADPDRFDMSRGQPGLGFGHGVHYCVGAALARMETRVALDTVLSKVRSVERVPGEIPYNRTLVVRGPTSLRLRITPQG